MNCSTPGLPAHHQLLEFTQTHVHWVGDAMQPSHPLSPPSPPTPIPPSIRVFSNESTLPMRWPKYWSFSFGIIPSKEHPGLISFRMDWLDLLGVQGTLKSLLQHHSKPVHCQKCIMEENPDKPKWRRCCQRIGLNASKTSMVWKTQIEGLSQIGRGPRNMILTLDWILVWGKKTKTKTFSFSVKVWGQLVNWIRFVD